MPPALSHVLEHTGAKVRVCGFDDFPAEPVAGETDAIVVVVPHDQSPLDDFSQLLTRLSQCPCGTLVLTDAPLNGLASVPIPPELPLSFSVCPSEDELLRQLDLLCQYAAPLRTMVDRVESARRHGQRLVDQANHHYEQLKLASQVQRDFLPQNMPKCPGARFITLYRPAEYVSGDIYEITRIDESHVGISVADVTGHGVPAALLTLFIKHALCMKEIRGNDYRILPPDEVLVRLNRSVLAADLQQCQFVTACHIVYDYRQRVVSWARGGSPYPVLIRPGEPVRQIVTQGDLIGAFDEAHFQTHTELLRPGDTMLFFTDGLEALLLMGNPAGRLDHLCQTDWFTRLGTLTADEHVLEIDDLLIDASQHPWPVDDLTVVALCVED